MKFPRASMLLLTAIFVAIGFASPGNAVRQTKIFGVVDDNNVMSASAHAGFDVVKRTIWIRPTNNTWSNPNKGYERIPDVYRAAIDDSMKSAAQADVKVIAELYLIPGTGAPRGPSQMRGTCDVAKDFLDEYPETYGIEVGVEPNSSTFWRPQFNPDGTQASAAPYLKWLSICYDKIKQGHPGVIVIGGSLSSRGEDQPDKPSSDSSPVLWLQKFCQAYNGSGRMKPVMDWFDMHSYPDPEDQDPTVPHPYPSTTITIADYDKLSGLLDCFNGTAQPKPLILWGETGYNTDVPAGMVGNNYSKAAKPSSVRLVDESTQGRYAAEQIQMSSCQAGTVGWLNFHFVDDPNRADNWQSGFAYAPPAKLRGSSSAKNSYQLKQSMPAVRKALDAARNGSSKCGSPGSP